MSPRPSATIVLALATVLTARAEAAGSESAASEAIEDARRLVDVELRFKEAIERLDGALADPRITQKEKTEAYVLLAIAYVARGANDDAEEAFTSLLGIDPDYELDPTLSPKISRVFKRVRDRIARMPRILELTAVRRGDNVAFTARVEDVDDRLASITLYSRAGGAAYREQLMDREGDLLRAVIEPVEVEEGSPLRVEYYVLGRDAGGSPIARVSDAANPSAVIVEKPRIDLVARSTPDDEPNAAPAGDPNMVELEEETPWYGTWWFWTIAIGAIGAGTAVVVLTRGGGDPPAGTLDPIQLP